MPTGTDCCNVLPNNSFFQKPNYSKDLNLEKSILPASLYKQVYPIFPAVDTFAPQVQEKKAPEISGVRVFFNRLTDEQISQVNESKQLPKNAKVVDDVAIGKPRLTWNLFDITPGTHKIPAGYELKKDILGFTHLVREGTQAWYLKK